MAAVVVAVVLAIADVWYNGSGRLRFVTRAMLISRLFLKVQVIRSVTSCSSVCRLFFCIL